MADQRDPPREVAYLLYRRTAQPDSGEHLKRASAIYGNDEFDIGRQDVFNALELHDRSVSTHHIRVRCVLYDDDVKQRVAPMVYARVLSSNPVILRRNGIDNQQDGIAITRDHGDILLNTRDRLQLTNQVELEYRTTQGAFNAPPLDSICRAEAQQFSVRYQMTPRVLGIGGYAAVYVAVKQRTGQQYACKIMPLPTLDDIDDDLDDARRDHALKVKYEVVAREFNVLRKLSHPNIITLEKVFRTTHNVYMFQELTTGGDLLSYLEMRGALGEPETAMIIRQILEAVNYMHDNGVVHRDIKPENILMTSWREGSRVVLTDFGQSRTVADMETAAKKAGVFRMYSQVGTVGYTAPEIVNRVKQDLQQGSGYSKAVDVWSVGCVTATCLTNEVIIPDHVDMKTLKANELVKYIDILDDPGTPWRDIGWRAKDFIRGCLAPDESNRLAAADCLEEAWFTHPYYKDDFDAAYKRAIQDWKPKEYDEDIVEFIDTSRVTVSRQPERQSETISRHFPVKPSAPSQGQSDITSQIRRFRPLDDLHASPLEVPGTPTHKQHGQTQISQSPETQLSVGVVTQTQSQSFEVNEFLPPPPAPSSFLERNLAQAKENSIRNSETAAIRQEQFSKHFQATSYRSKPVLR